ncbi:MAG: glutamate dehydrogenase, partial [Pseudonocardia sp.]
IETAQHRGCPVETAAAIHTRSDSELGLTWLTGRLDDHVTTNWWDAMAAATVRDDLAERHHELVGAILDLDTGGEDQIRVWQARAADAISRFSRMTAELRRDGVVDVSRACTASAELKLLVRSTGVGGAEDTAA